MTKRSYTDTEKAIACIYMLMEFGIPLKSSSISINIDHKTTFKLFRLLKKPAYSYIGKFIDYLTRFYEDDYKMEFDEKFNRLQYQMSDQFIMAVALNMVLRKKNGGQARRSGHRQRGHRESIAQVPVASSPSTATTWFMISGRTRPGLPIPATKYWQKVLAAVDHRALAVRPGRTLEHQVLGEQFHHRRNVAAGGVPAVLRAEFLDRQIGFQRVDPLF